MEIFFDGRPNKKVSEREMRYACDFFTSLIIPQAKLRNLMLHIEFRRLRADDSFGYCVPLSDTEFPQEFELAIDHSIGRLTQLGVLAHEIVHVKQFSLGELFELEKSYHYRWKGEQMDVSGLHEFDFPWEIEANGMERGMVYRYQEHLTKEGIDFQKEVVTER